MLALIIGAIVTVIAAFGASYFGAWLQRKWTPNPIPAIKGVETRVHELRQRVDEIEQDRFESETFTLGIRLVQAISANWIIEVANDTDKDVYVETIRFFRDGIPLSGLDKPKKPEDGRIPAHSKQQLCWTPQPEPLTALKFSGTEPHRYTLPYRFVLCCRTAGKLRTAEGTVHLTYEGYQFMAYP